VFGSQELGRLEDEKSRNRDDSSLARYTEPYNRQPKPLSAFLCPACPPSARRFAVTKHLGDGKDPPLLEDPTQSPVDGKQPKESFVPPGRNPFDHLTSLL
jgi:hypothetical protein